MKIYNKYLEHVGPLHVFFFITIIIIIICCLLVIRSLSAYFKTGARDLKSELL